MMMMMVMVVVVVVVVGTVTVSLGRLSQSSTVCESTDRINTVVLMSVLFIIVPWATGRFLKRHNFISILQESLILIVFYSKLCTRGIGRECCE